jgi:hypothetical protein
MRKSLWILFLLFPGITHAHAGGNPADEILVFVYLAGFMLLVLALFEIPRTIKKIRIRMSEKKRMRQEKREAEKHNEENHYFIPANL